MQLWCNSLLVKLTLFFFTTIQLYQPVYAEQSVPVNPEFLLQLEQNDFPIAYISDAEAQQLVGEFLRQGYVVQEGTLAQLDQLTQNSNKRSQDNKDSNDNLKGKEIEKDKDCKPENISSDVPQQENLQGDIDPAPLPVPDPPPVSHPATPSQANISVHADLSYSTGGSSSDAAKVFFIVIGVVVVAAFVIYAGKYIVDMVGGKDYKLWWEVIFNSTFMGTDSGQHGRFFGVKMATGFVSSELIQIALLGEVGNTDMNLILNENTDPAPLDFSGAYWMLGATARIHLTDKPVNASYLYLDLMGGTTDNSTTDTIGTARIGASFGINDYMRLGASLGAQYIGLDEDQGFVNDADNYWVTYGFEIGARF